MSSADVTKYLRGFDADQRDRERWKAFIFNE